MYEAPNTYERHTTVVFTFASDDEHEAKMREALNAKLLEIALDLGYDCEIHDENMLADPVPMETWQR